MAKANEKEEQGKDNEKEIFTTFEKNLNHAEPFLADFDDLRKEFKKSNIDQQPLDIAGDNLFAELDRMLSG